MSELSPRARQLLRSSVKAATPADRDRIRSALQVRLGTLAPVATSTALPAAGSRWSLVSGAILGLGLIGGVLFLWTRHGPEGAPSLATSGTPVVAAAPVPVPAEVASGTVSTPQIPAVVDAPDPRSLPAPDRLGQELALMERATTALHAGRPATALKVLDEYQQRFPNGSLTLERRAARAQALCALGRGSEAQQELSALPARSPGVARAMQVCAAASKAAH